MKSKIVFVVTLMLTILASTLLLAPVNASTFPNLPPGSVTLQVTSPLEVWPATVLLSNVPPGYDVANGYYTPAWCVELGTPITGDAHSALLSSTLGMGEIWNKINYLINKYAGGGLDVQLAIWRLLGHSQSVIEGYGWIYTANANVMYVDANNNGASFVPSAGEQVGVYCTLAAQDLLIQLSIPQTLSPGLTPGFWKHNVGVYLGLSKGAYSDPVGATAVTKATMGAWLASLTQTDLGGKTLQALYNEMSTIGGGAAGAATRNIAANVFNALAGLAPLP